MPGLAESVIFKPTLTPTPALKPTPTPTPDSDSSIIVLIGNNMQPGWVGKGFLEA